MSEKEKREVTIPTCVSISESDDNEYIVVRDLNGKQYICPIESPEKLGKKIIELVKNKTLPPFDVAHLTATNEGTKQETNKSPLGGINFNDFSGGDVQSKLLQAGLNMLGNLNNYPRTGKR